MPQPQVRRISQKEYFQLQAFFANTSEVANIPAENRARTKLHIESSMAEWEEATKDVRAQRKALIDSFREEAPSITTSAT